jgi:hypothetical protein
MVVERRSSLTIIGKKHSKLAFRPRGLRRPRIWSRLSTSPCNRGITQPFYPVGITPLASGWWKSTISSERRPVTAPTSLRPALLIEQLEIDRSQRTTARAHPPQPGAVWHLSLRQRAFSSGSTRVSSLSSEQSGDIAVIVSPEW